METSVASPLPLPPVSTAAPPVEPAPPPAASSCSSPPSTVTLISKCTVYPSLKSTMGDLKLSVSDLPMLSCHYIQKGLLFPRPPVPIHQLLSLLRLSLSRALSHFPALAGRLVTHHDGRIFISCNDAGVPFSHFTNAAVDVSSGAPVLTLPQITLSASTADVPAAVRDLFDLDGAVSYEGHFRPLAAVRVTELSDGSLFVGCTVNHAVVDGTSFWNFFNSWAELCRLGGLPAVGISRPPDFRRNFFGESTAVLRFAEGRGPEVTFSVDAPLRERIFHFRREAIQELKSTANRPIGQKKKLVAGPIDDGAIAEIYGKQIHDVGPKNPNRTAEISSFQSLCAMLWRSVTRARRKLPLEATTTFRMAVNCRLRVEPPVDPRYFGNAIQSIPTVATVGKVASRELRWAAGLLHRSVLAHGGEKVRRGVEEWEGAPRCFPLGNPDGSGVTMGSSPRFPMYDNDFGWGRPVAVRSGRANKFDGKISAFPGRDGDGSVDLEVCLAPDTMAALVSDTGFMQYVSEP